MKTMNEYKDKEKVETLPSKNNTRGFLLAISTRTLTNKIRQARSQQRRYKIYEDLIQLEGST